MVLVGNKCDCEERRLVTYEQGLELADRLGCPFFETSSKYDVNVDDAFEKLIDIICDNMRATGESETTNNDYWKSKQRPLSTITYKSEDACSCWQLC